MFRRHEEEAGAGCMVGVRATVWWLHPCCTVLLVVVPGAVAAAIVPPDLFRAWWHAPKYFNIPTALLLTAGLGAFMSGSLMALVPLRNTPPGSPAWQRRKAVLYLLPAQQKLLLRAGQLLLAPAFASYILWTALGIARGYSWEHLLAVVQLDESTLAAGTRLLHPAGGLTTLTQFGPPAVACLTLHTRATGRRHTLPLVVLTVFACLRALLYTECLPLIELLLPAVVIAAVLAPHCPPEQRRAQWGPMPRSRGWAWAPLAGLLIALCLLAVFDFPRSWNEHHRGGASGYGTYVLGRLSGYYATAANNSAFLAEKIAPTQHLPDYTMKFLRHTLGLSGTVPDSALHPAPADPTATVSVSWNALIAPQAPPALNSDGGLLAPFYDYGPIGAVLIWVLLGYLLARCYRLARTGNPGALIGYSLLYIGILELGHSFYWGQSSFMPALATTLTLTWLLRHTSPLPHTPHSYLAKRAGQATDPPAMP
ncbi:O-antigen polymerase [Streptomyces klenkii]